MEDTPLPNITPDVITALEENYCVVVACKDTQIQDIVYRNMRHWLPEPIGIVKTNPML